MADQARALIQKLDLAPHPEGGWYRETWRSETHIGGRAIGTAIIFLLEHGQRSAWHQVDADEFWLWHTGAPLALRIGDSACEKVDAILLGPDVLTGQQPQARVPTHAWQAAHAAQGWSLVSCLVVPGFEFAGFKLAPTDLAAQLDALSGGD
ncbi:MAG: cupin domain-containing protein [Hyphomonadaceae bacterium]|nr:cupin domain-containing protein [Hyphomonadaceae bacterium]